jgi:hypothetical protein
VIAMSIISKHHHSVLELTCQRHDQIDFTSSDPDLFEKHDDLSTRLYRLRLSIWGVFIVKTIHLQLRHCNAGSGSEDVDVPAHATTFSPNIRTLVRGGALYDCGS